MFRWCAYCQHLIGESPPLDDYAVTHGICEPCSENIETYSLEPEVLRAKELFRMLELAGRSGEFGPCASAVDEALAAGIRPSEIMVGVLHPALGRVGELWETGKITVADEHRFTDFVLGLQARFDRPHEQRDGPALLLAPLEDNYHDIGLHLVQHLAWERNLQCERLPAGTSRHALVEAVDRRRPALVGLSVGLLDTIPAAAAFVRQLAHDLPPGTTLVLGGQAFRRADTPNTLNDLPVLPTIDAVVAQLDRLEQEQAAASRRLHTMGSPPAGPS